MSLAEAVERGSKESRKRERKRKKSAGYQASRRQMEKWIGRCGRGVAGGVGATGWAEKYRTAGGGIAGVSADRRQDKSRARMQGSKRSRRARRRKEEKRREEKGNQEKSWCRCEVCDDAASGSELALAGC